MSEKTYNPFRRRRSEERALTAQSASPIVTTSAAGLSTVGTSTALRVADVFACVRVLSDAAASVPLIAYRSVDQGRVRYDGRIAELLRQPAPGFTQANLIGQAVAHLCIFGNAYVGKFRDANGRVDQLALLHPDLVTPELKNGLLKFTVTGTDGRQTTVGTEDVIHIRALGTDGLVGLSPIKQCAVAVGLADGMQTFANAFIKNGARPSGLLKLAPHTSADGSARIQEVFSDKYAGAHNAHKIAVIAGEVDWLPITVPADDLQFVEQRQLSTQEIARIFRVPAHMIGAPTGDSLTYASTEQASLNFVMWSLRPTLVAIEQALTNDPDLSPKSVFVEFLLDALLRADAKTRAEVYALALAADNGWMTREEVRRRENLYPANDASGGVA